MNRAQELIKKYNLESPKKATPSSRWASEASESTMSPDTNSRAQELIQKYGLSVPGKSTAPSVTPSAAASPAAPAPAASKPSAFTTWMESLANIGNSADPNAGYVTSDFNPQMPEMPEKKPVKTGLVEQAQSAREAAIAAARPYNAVQTQSNLDKQSGAEQPTSLFSGQTAPAVQTQTDYNSEEVQKQKADLKEQRDALVRQAAELSMYGAEYSGEIEEIKGQISALDEQIEALQKPMTFREHVGSAGTAIRSGLESAGLTVTNALDWMLGEKSLPWAFLNELATLVTGEESPLSGKNPITALQQQGQQEVAYWQNQAAIKAAGNDLAETVGKHSASIAQSSPFILMNILSLGVAGTAAAGTSEGLNYVSTINSAPALQQISTIAAKSLEGLASNPTAQYSFVSTFGSSYQDALGEGATEAEATVYALLNAGFGTIVEMGGGLEAMPEQLMNAMQGGNTSFALEYAKDIAHEIGEEEIQRVLELGLKFGYSDVEWMDQDNPDAILNAQSIGETALDTAIDTAVMGGVQSGIQYGANAVANAVQPLEQQTPEADRAYATWRSALGDVLNDIDMMATEEDGRGNQAPTTKREAVERQFASEAQAQVDGILSGETVSNRMAEQIVNDPEMAQAFAELTGVELTGTKSEQRKAVKDAAANYGQPQEAQTVTGEEAQQTEEKPKPSPRRSPEARKAAAKAAYEHERERLNRESPERQEFLKGKRKEHGELLDGLEVGDRVFTNANNSPAFEVSSKDENGMSLTFYDADGEVMGIERVLPDTMTGDSTYSAIELADDIRVEKGQGTSQQPRKPGKSTVQVKTENRNAVMKGIIQREAEKTGAEISDDERATLAEAFNVDDGIKGSTYAAAVVEAYQLGKEGKVSLKEARSASSKGSAISNAQFERAYELGKRATQGVTLDANLRGLGRYAGDAASVFEDGQDAAAYGSAMTEAITRYTSQGVDVAPVVQSDRKSGGTLGVLTDAQVAKATEIGQKMQAAQDRAAKKRGESLRSRKRAGTRQEGKVTYANDSGTVGGAAYTAVNRSKLSGTQKAVANIAEAVAKHTGLDIRVADFGSGVGGAYVPGTGGVLYLNINASFDGANIAAGSLGHELTHFLQEYAPEDYRTLKKIIAEEFNKDPQAYASIFEARQATEGNLTPDQITDEMAANACQTMLADPEVVQRIVNEHRSLAERLRDFILRIIDDIKAAFSEIDTSSNFPLYQEVRAAEGAMDRMREVWLNAFGTATENLQAEKAEIGSYNLEDFQQATDTDGKPLFQIYAFKHDEQDYRDMLIRWGKMSKTQVDDLFKLIDAAMAKIEANLEALDYAWEEDINDRAFQPIKQNSDKLYKVSQDFSTLCRKRLLQGLIAGQLSASLQRGLSKEEGIAVRDALLAIQEEGKQIEVACALCYVESARMRSQKAIQEFLNDRAGALQNYFAGKTGKEAVAEAEKAERQAIYDELYAADSESDKPESEWGLIRGKGDDATLYDVRDAKTAKMSVIPTNIKKRIQDAKKAAKTSYAFTEKQQSIVDEAMSLPVTEYTTPEGLQDLAKNHREIFNAFVLKVAAASKSKGIENDTWWRAGDSASIGDTLIEQMNAENGLRTQSWSDFQVKHLMDYIAATIEMSTRNAKQHAYTKVLDYVKLMGNTGVMINMSLIPTREFNGKLEYDDVEGIKHKEAFQLRIEFPDTAGTICIGMDEEQIRMLLESDLIDYVIPYHQSGMSKDTRAKMHIPAWKDYQDFQGEKRLSGQAAKDNAAKYGVELLSEDDPNWHEPPKFSDWFDLRVAQQEAQLAGKEGKYGVMTGGYAAMQSAADTYKKLCAERGLMPKFSYGRADFSNEPNYWKLLIDRKMVNNVTGDIIEQKALKPVFDFDTVQRILDEELARYGTVKKDQEEAIQRVTGAFLRGEVKGGMSSEQIREVMQKPVDNIPITNITQNAKYMEPDTETEKLVRAESEDDAPSVAESKTQLQKWDEDLPVKTQYGFKLMSFGKDGLPHALFIDSANPYELGRWYTADSPKMENLISLEPGYAYLVDENDVADQSSRKAVRKVGGQFRGLPGKTAVDKATADGKRWMVVDQYADGSKSIHNVGINGSGTVSTYALRPGIHAVDIPSMKHIGAKSTGSAKIDTRRPNQRWYLIEYPVDMDYNQEAYQHETKDIREHLPTKGWYSFQTNSGAEARQHWFITGGMRIVGAISEEDARRYARERGFEEDLPWKDGKIYSDLDAIDLDEYIHTTKAQPTPSKEEMRQRIEAERAGMQLQRWDNNDDTKSERRGRSAAYTRLQNENAILKDTVRALKKQGTKLASLQKQLQLTKDPETRQSDARKLAKALIVETGSEADVNKIADEIKKLGDTLLQTDPKQLTEETLKAQARAIASGILTEAKDAVTLDDEAMDVNPYDAYMSEATEDLANRIVMDAMSGVLRPTAPTKADKQLARTKALQEHIQQLKAEQKMTQREAASLYHTIYDLSVALDRAESRYATLRTEADYRAAQIRAEGAARAAEIKAKERARADNLLQEQKEHYQEMAARARERREESAGVTKYRKQVEQKAKKLYEMLMTNSNDLHVPEVLKAPLGEFLESLDFTSKRSLAGGADTKADEKFGARLIRIQQMLANQQSYINGDGNIQQDLGGYIDVSPEILDYLRNMAEMITTAMNMGRTFTVNQMTAQDLKTLSDFLGNLRTAIKNMNYFMANARYETVKEAAQADIAEMDMLGRVPEKANAEAVRFAWWENGTPYYIMKRIGAGAKSLFDGFANGWERLAFNAQEIINFTGKAYTDKEVKDWKKTIHDITLADGSEIKMTTAQIMELTMLLGREQAVKHISRGGIRIGDIETRNGLVKGTRHDTKHYHLTDEDIRSITGMLTPRQVEVAQKLQRFMADKGAEWGNEVSMRRFGYKFYEEGPGYYPIKTDSNDRPMADTDAQTNSMFRLLNLSASKSLNPKASNALVVGDIFETFADHMADMAKLNGMGLPILDAIKWFNYKERINHDDGTYDTVTLQGALEQAFGEQAQRYFRTLMKDINGVSESGDRGTSLPKKLMSNYKIAAVAANLRVALLQPTSYVRAMTVLKPKYMAGIVPSRAAYREAMKYSGTAVWKALGYYETDISRGLREKITHDDSFRDKFAEASLTFAELGDQATWSMLWQACKRQAKGENADLSQEALMDKTAELFREVIYSSQVMDSTLTRSEIMRGKTGWTKAMSAFMAEPTLSYNILMDAFSKLNLDARKHGKAEAWKRNSGKLGKAFTVYVTSAAFAAVVESIADAVRDDDDEEFWEKFRQALWGEKGPLSGNLTQDLTVLGKLPYVKNFISTLQGYNSGDMSVAAFSNLVNVYSIWEETLKLKNGELDKATKVTYYGKMTKWGKVYKTLQALSQLSGFAVSNLTRDVTAIWNTAMNGRRDDWKIRTYNPNLLSQSKAAAYEQYAKSTGVTEKQYERILASANLNGGSVSQNEMGRYLTDALNAGDLTMAQANAVWKSLWNKAGSTTFADWRAKNK